MTEPAAAEVAATRDAVGGHGLTFCENGMIGWDDNGFWYDKGTAADDGHLVVGVQLFKGKDQSTEPKAGVAQGHRILCRIALSPFRIPPRGTPVVVLIPGGDIQTPGNCVVVAAIEENPFQQLDEKRVVFDFGNETHVLIRGASVSLQDTAAGPACFVGVGTPFTGGARGIYAIDETGSGFSTQSGEVGVFASSGGAATSMVHLTATEADVIVKGGSLCGLKATGGDITLFGANSYLYTAGVYLGALATALNTALWGPTGVAGAASTSVYLSP